MVAAAKPADGGETTLIAPHHPWKTAGQLTAATGDPVFPPWMEGGDPSNGMGFESALVYALAGEMGVGVTWVRTTFDQGIAPGAKDYDFNIQQYSITSERAQVVTFSDPYYVAEQAIIATDVAALSGATSLADLKSARLAAAIGTTSLDYLENEIQPDNDPTVFDDNGSARAALDAGEIDGLVVDLPNAYFVIDAEIEGSSIIGVLPRTSGSADELGMVFEKDNPLASCVNAALATLRDNGAMESLEERWLNRGGQIPTLSE